jgi:hypothetical protein
VVLGCQSRPHPFTTPFPSSVDTFPFTKRFGNTIDLDRVLSSYIRSNVLAARWRRQALHQIAHGTNLSFEEGTRESRTCTSIDLFSRRNTSSDS